MSSLSLLFPIFFRLSLQFQVYLIKWLILQLMQQLIKLVMKEPQKSNRKAMGEFRKHSISEKTRSDNTNPFAGKEDHYAALLTRDMKSLGRKYVQENLFKGKEKDHHEIVISDELVRNSRQFRMLREKMQMKEAVYSKQFNELNETKCKLKQEIAEIKSSSYNSKLALWELKNQILELKGILNDEEEENRRLERELTNPQQEYFEEEGNEYQEGQEEENHLQEERQQIMQQEKEELRNAELSINSQERDQLSQQEVDIRLVVSQMKAKQKKMNPENRSEIRKKDFDEDIVD